MIRSAASSAKFFMHLNRGSNTGQRVIVGLSGGVDSAVAAHLLIEQGYRIEALFMKNWEEDDDTDYCAAAVDLRDAQAVADRLGIPLHKVNFSTEYWDRVFAHFLDEYRAARTPNPDILCNKEIKFAAFLEHAMDLGADWIATGHYASVTRDATGSRLRLCSDADKDQTYFLHLLNQAQLARSLFPLSHLTKPRVRSIARELDLDNAGKKDHGHLLHRRTPVPGLLAALYSETPGTDPDAGWRCPGRAPGPELLHHWSKAGARDRRR